MQGVPKCVLYLCIDYTGKAFTTSFYQAKSWFLSWFFYQAKTMHNFSVVFLKQAPRLVFVWFAFLIFASYRNETQSLRRFCSMKFCAKAFQMSSMPAALKGFIYTNFIALLLVVLKCSSKMSTISKCFRNSYKKRIIVHTVDNYLTYGKRYILEKSDRNH